MNPDGSTVTKTPTKNLTYAPPVIAVTDNVVEVAKDPAGNTTGTTGTAAPAEMPQTCGYPGGPPCKIDETGTPTEAEPLPDPDVLFAPLHDQPVVADPQWTWAFQFPSACSVLSVGTFGGKAVSLDLCKYQGTIHSIMSMVWLMLTVFLCIGLVSRTLQGS